MVPEVPYSKEGPLTLIKIGGGLAGRGLIMEACHLLHHLHIFWTQRPDQVECIVLPATKASLCSNQIRHRCIGHDSASFNSLSALAFGHTMLSCRNGMDVSHAASCVTCQNLYTCHVNGAAAIQYNRSRIVICYSAIYGTCCSAWYKMHITLLPCSTWPMHTK